MPNRILKESICTSDTIENLSLFEEVFFYRLIVNCDDYGCFDARPRVLRSRLFPLKDIREKLIEDALHKLSLAGIVVLYECEGRPYLQLAKWDKHQQIRAVKGKYPRPGDNGVIIIRDTASCIHPISDDISRYQVISDAPVIQSNPDPNKDKKNTMCKADALALFEKLWSSYPCKKGKGKVSDRVKLCLLEVGEEQMIRCIERYKVDLREEPWKHPQNGSTFFNTGYVDYLDENYSPMKKGREKGGNDLERHNYDMDELESKLLQGRPDQNT